MSYIGQGTSALDATLAINANKTALADSWNIKGSDVASASTINLESTTGNLIDVTGTVAITAITLAEGHERTVRFTGALTLTHGSSLVLPGQANITTAAGDFAVFRGYPAGVVRCVEYSRISGLPVAMSTATQSDQETGTSNTVYVTPGTQKHHPSSPKAWAYVTQSGGTYTLAASFGVSSISKTATGRVNIILSTAFSSTNYAAIGTINDGPNLVLNEVKANRTTTNFRAQIVNANNNQETDANFSVVFYGDQ